MIGTVYVSHFRLFTNQNAQIEIANQNKIALDEMVNQIREATFVFQFCCSPQQFTRPVVLILRLWPLNASKEPCSPGSSGCTDTEVYDYTIYKCSTVCAPGNTTPTNLIKEVVPGVSTLGGINSFRTATSGDIIASNVKDLRFKYYTSTGIEKTCTPLYNCVFSLFNIISVNQVEITLTIQSSTFTQTQPHTVTQSAKAILRNYGAI